MSEEGDVLRLISAPPFPPLAHVPTPEPRSFFWRATAANRDGSGRRSRSAAILASPRRARSIKSLFKRPFGSGEVDASRINGGGGGGGARLLAGSPPLTGGRGYVGDGARSDVCPDKSG